MAVSLSAMALSRQRPEDVDGATRPITTRWLLWAVAGWVLAGGSNTGQLLAAMHAPDSPFGVVLSFSGVAACVLLVVCLFRRSPLRSGRELLGGLASGAFMACTGGLIQVALQHASAAVVFPTTIGGPVVLVLLLGRLVYRERLGPWGWAACLLGVVSLALLSIGQATTP